MLQILHIFESPLWPTLGALFLSNIKLNCSFCVIGLLSLKKIVGYYNGGVVGVSYTTMENKIVTVHKNMITY